MPIEEVPKRGEDFFFFAPDLLHQFEPEAK